ncbi:glutamate--cysteine ligase [Rhodocyclaceae bacterium SMB388]
MTDTLSRRLGLLERAEHIDLLRHSLHGLEKESLRVDAAGYLALTPHPPALGSALTHPQITTDYSEALLEFITSAQEDPSRALDELDAIHRYAYAQLGDEMLWCESMPCKLPSEADIPIARYGPSHIGQIKHIYRKGLAVRYGKAMQCIAGIHYNFSLDESLWRVLHQADGDTIAAQDYQSARYIALIRNFQRYSWLLMYLFGASPAVCATFLTNRVHGLDEFDPATLYLPWATSLRMSDLGYQNSAQASIQPCYNCLPSYLDKLREAVTTPYPPYVAIGMRRGGEWLQLNTSILQIENEYYSTIRPKRVSNPGERPIQALGARGVQYVEVRCMDIDPFVALGIELTTARFLDAFLLYCALEDSPAMSGEECRETGRNFALTVKEGRRPGLVLQRLGQPRELLHWGLELLERIGPCAALLDAALGTDAHREAVAAQRAKLLDPELTPSARVLSAMREDGLSFGAFALRQSERHAAWFRERPLDPATQQAFEQAARDSLAAQSQVEQEQQGEFADFVAHYMAALDAGD